MNDPAKLAQCGPPTIAGIGHKKGGTCRDAPGLVDKAFFMRGLRRIKRAA
jgi:hypothetical protein